MAINRICILGHSGIGKTNLAGLFKVKGWEPYRVRIPRDADDAKVCMSPPDFQRLLSELAGKKPLYEGNAGFKAYEHWSVLNVRGKDQILNHSIEAKSDDTLLRVEIFAPVLVEILRNRDKLTGAFSLDPSRTLVILLNPTGTSFRDMGEPSPELRLSTAFAVAERYRAGGKAVDLADVIQRIEHLRDELSAWREMFATGAVVVECTKWEHFEYRYKATGDYLAEARRAHKALSKAIEKHAGLDEQNRTAVLNAVTEPSDR
jgi:hypothetical protein